MSEEKRFTYEIEIDKDMIGDEKIGDVILRLENELCQEEVNFFNVMSKSKTKSKSKIKQKENEGMLIFKEKRKIIQYLKDNEEKMVIQKNLTLNKMKNGNLSSASTTEHSFADSKSIFEDGAMPKNKRNRKKVNQLRKMIQEDPNILHKTESPQAIEKDPKSEACCLPTEEILKTPVEKQKRTKSQMTKEEWKSQKICWN